MAEESVNSAPQTPQPPPPRPRSPVIRMDTYGDEGAGRILRRQVPAWVISLGIHFVLLVAVIAVNLIMGDRGLKAAVAQDTTIETKVEEEEKDKNFENPDIGLDPNLPTNYNIDRIEDVSVAGPLKPDEAPGNNGPNDTPMTLPPPPGIGDSSGQGGGVDSALNGVAALGAAGGIGGPPMLPGMGFKGRSGATRQKMLTEGGGNTISEACVTRGLMWLAKMQRANGSWEIDGSHKSTIAGTGIALLPFLAAGQTHKSNNKDIPGGGKYQKNVENGLKYLKSAQKADGSFTNSPTMYDHAIATMALCEAYGMTADPTLKAPAQLAVNYIVKAQHSAGGWRYSPGTPGDLSVTGWQIQALKSAQLASLSVPKEIAAKSTQFLDQVSGGQGTAKGSMYGYVDAGGSPSMTAVGLLCRQYLGWGPKQPKLALGVQELMKIAPRKDMSDTKQLDMYYYYYATQVIHFYGGPEWHEQWNPKMRDWLIQTQVRGNQNEGSWNPDGAHAGAGGRLVMTAMALLTLEVYYRHLPLYKRDAGGMQALENS